MGKSDFIKNNPTHIYFNGENLTVSPNLKIVFDFLTEIWDEVDSSLNRKKQLDGIRKQYLENMNIMYEMFKIIKMKNINVNFRISEHPKTIVDKLKFHPSPRSEFIVLFASLETLRTLWTAYDLETTNEQKLRNAANKTLEKFYKKFCLCAENKWVKNNPDIAGKIGVTNLRKLRNSLTHFFSISGIAINLPQYKNKTKKITNKTNNKIQFISSDDLLEIIEGAFKLIIERWIADYNKSSTNKNSIFEQKIKCVIKIVKENRPISLHNKDTHILKDDLGLTKEFYNNEK